MALHHEIPAERPEVTDPAYQRFVWARYLRQEVAHKQSLGSRKGLIALTFDGALELADALDPVARKVR